MNRQEIAIEVAMWSIGNDFMDLSVARDFLGYSGVYFRSDDQAERFAEIAEAREMERKNRLEQQLQAQAHQADCDEGLL